jgi:hypothetical protein
MRSSCGIRTTALGYSNIMFCDIPFVMSREPESLVLQFMRDIRGEIRDIRAEMATKGDLAALRSELRSEIRDVASDLAITRKELGEQIVGLRRAVVEYHSAVVGHGVLISDLDARLRRVEQHLSLPSADH